MDFFDGAREQAEHWVMNNAAGADAATGNNCYCKRCAAGSPPVPSPNSIGLGIVQDPCSDWGEAFLVAVGLLSL